LLKEVCVSTSLPSSPNLEFEKKRAKELLSAWRAGDAAAIARVRVHAAHLAESASPRLADAQHVIAREHGFESWPTLKAHIEAARPLDAQVDHFLGAIRDQSLAVARRVLTERPEVAHANIHAAAAAADDVALARLLEADAALATAPDAAGWPPLVYACWSGFHSVSPALAASSLRCAQRLLDAGADANSATPVPKGEDGALLSALYRACESNNIAIVRLLLERGAKPDDGESVYHAAQHGHLECLDLLLAFHADISSRHPHWRNTPLYFLAGHADDERGQAAWLKGMRWLLEHGADPNVTSSEPRETPLHKIVTQPRTLAALDALLEHGADVNIARGDGRAPYALAVRAGNEAAAGKLREQGAHTDAVSFLDQLLGACARGDRAEALRLAASQPAWTSALGKEDRGALANAIWRDRIDAVRLFVELGFDLSWEADWGGSPLHHAAWLGKPAFVRLLIEAGAPVNMRDSQFASSPIAWASHGSTNCRSADDDYCAVVEALLDAGASWEAAVNKWGEPPFNTASKRVAARLRERAFGPAG